MREAERQDTLLRLLGVTFGVAVILGGTLGVGILRTPGEVAGHLGRPWVILLAWTLGGVYSMLGAMSVTELGAALPQAGGFYVYVRRAFGDRSGLAIGWRDFLGQLAAVALAALAVGEYRGELIPALRPQGRMVRPLRPLRPLRPPARIVDMFIQLSCYTGRRCFPRLSNMHFGPWWCWRKTTARRRPHTPLAPLPKCRWITCLR